MNKVQPRPIRAIRTRYLGHTNTLPSRIVASTDTGHRETLSTSGFDSNEEAHFATAQFLADKLGWGKFQGAGVYEGDYYWVLAHKEN